MKENIQISFRIARLIEDYMQSSTREMQPDLQKWLAESEVNKQLFDRIVNGSDWNEKLERYDQLKQSTQWSDLQQKRKKGKNMRVLWLRSVQVAAVLALTLLVGGVAGYFLSKQTSETAIVQVQRYRSTKGSISVIELPDSTKIWLNSDSELTYSEDKQTNRRLVSLKGEAFFEVTHRDDFPMEVTAGSLVIRDLGTSFNIKAYPESNVVETSLMEGKVDILSDKRKEIVALVPGEIARFDSDSRKMDVSRFSPNIISAWKDGKCVIRDQRMEDIFNELSHWYDVTFVFENQELRDFRYTGIIRKSTTVNQVLKMLKQSTHIDYRVQETAAGKDIVIIY